MHSQRLDPGGLPMAGRDPLRTSRNVVSLAMTFRWISLVALGLALSSCSDAGLNGQARQFSGVWLYEFEGSTFIEGATEIPKERPAPKETDWLEWVGQPRLEELMDKSLGNGDCYTVQPILVTFVGRRDVSSIRRRGPHGTVAFKGDGEQNDLGRAARPVILLRPLPTLSGPNATSSPELEVGGFDAVLFAKAGKCFGVERNRAGQGRRCSRARCGASQKINLDEAFLTRRSFSEDIHVVHANHQADPTCERVSDVVAKRGEHCVFHLVTLKLSAFANHPLVTFGMSADIWFVAAGDRNAALPLSHHAR
jgi:hypothetical protein